MLEIMVHQLEFDTIKSLSEVEAAGRLKQGGYNELPASKKRRLWAIAQEIARELIALLSSFVSKLNKTTSGFLLGKKPIRALNKNLGGSKNRVINLED
jgi:hypothetical protein